MLTWPGKLGIAFACVVLVIGPVVLAVILVALVVNLTPTDLLWWVVLAAWCQACWCWLRLWGVMWPMLDPRQR